MPALGSNATWSREEWSTFVLEHLAAESVLLRAGVRIVPISGAKAHVPRTLTDGTATWTAEGDEIDSNAPTGDDLELTPKKLANVVSLSNESIADAPVSELEAVGRALARSVATAIDARAFSASAATAIAPAGLLTLDLIDGIGEPSIDNIVRAVGAIEAVGGRATAVFLNPVDLTALRLVKTTDEAGNNMPVLQPDAQAGGAESVAGAGLWPTPPLPAGTAIVADASQIVVGIREDVDVAFSGDAAFTADSVVARVTARVDWGVNDTRGLVVLQDETP